ncbi:MAG: hypothetical protein HY299_18860 [Verrucomicrobia bacterium]|nr:hypothetical protein [Verrucomicrobiota bacterium]
MAASHAMRILKRIGNIIEGLVFGLLSLLLQSLFIGLLTGAVVIGLSALGLRLDGTPWPSLLFGLLLIAFNAIACWEYFVKERAVVRLGSKASIIFMVPRAIDLIWNGSERISR